MFGIGEDSKSKRKQQQTTKTHTLQQVDSRNDKLEQQSSHMSSSSNNKQQDQQQQDQNHDLIQQALDRAALTSVQAAAKAVSTGQGITQMYYEDNEILKLGSTEEVLASANSVLGKMNHRRPDLSIRLPEDAPADENDYDGAVQKLMSGFKQEDTKKIDSILNQVDGVVETTATATATTTTTTSPHKEKLIKDVTSTTSIKQVRSVATLIAKEQPEDQTSYVGWFQYFKDYRMQPLSSTTTEKKIPAVATSMVKVALESVSTKYKQAVDAMQMDPRMPEWITNQSSSFPSHQQPPTPYQLQNSKTVICHEIMRDGWTWSTAWSPNGDKLAVATENHHLAIIDTTSSPVWRVKHDLKLHSKGSSIRTVAWGHQFIAIGGTADNVSILAPTEPYPIIHTIPTGGFVGSLDWKQNTNTLIIGSRDGKLSIYKLGTNDDDDDDDIDDDSFVTTKQSMQSKILHTMTRKTTWINAVKFSPDGSYFCMGDDTGIVSVFTFGQEPNNVANFKMENAILDVQWSPNGQWLYAGGEDFIFTIIKTDTWEAVHRIKRDRWVQFVSSSYGGSHIAIGGVSSQVSILDVGQGWDTAINITLKGLNPLSAKWHPLDQYLVVTGQTNSILAVETTDARYVSGHCLQSTCPVVAIEFSPDGCMAAIGNEAGVVTIFKLTGTTFTTTYEMVLDCFGSLSIKWSRNGEFLVISAENKVVIVSCTFDITNTTPPNASGFSIEKVIRNVGTIYSVAIDPLSQYIAVCGTVTMILDSTSFDKVLELENGLTGSWSFDGNWFALIGENKNLVFYDTSTWKAIFDVPIAQEGLALAWGPPTHTGLQYCAYGGQCRKICILEIRNKEQSWEQVLQVPRDGVVYDLDWNNDGLVSAAIGNGTVTIMDLSYLQSGWAVNEMDYNWQRQALTCFTEIQRNLGKNSMQTVRWIPAAPGSDSLLAIGGTDGQVEIVDLTARKQCQGFSSSR